MHKMSTLVLFTFNSPNGSTSEASFLRVELEYLTRKFNRIIVVPQKLGDRTVSVDQNSYEINTSLHSLLSETRTRLETYTLAIKYPTFWWEFFKHLRNLQVERMKATLWFHGNGAKICEWFFSFCKEKDIDFSSTIFYSYWLDGMVYGLALAKRRYSSIKLISRAHGIDLYENRQPLSFFPFRNFILKYLNVLYLISSDGCKYISTQYPTYMMKYKLSRLGVRGTTQITKPSSDGEMRIVSCAYIRPVKRMDLMAQGIHSFALKNPNLHILWDHFGSKDKFEVKAPNLMVNFWGIVPINVVDDFYKNNSVDVFLNTSSSEGIPVSIMEAISNGIPVVAPSVGGIAEIVSSQNGVLLKANPSPGEIANALELFIPFSEAIAQKKRAGQRIWRENYDADKNYDQFSTDVASLLEQRE